MIEALVLLVLLWAALLVPSALRSRNASPHVTVGGFERAMDVLRSGARPRGTGRELLVPRDAGRIVSRAVDPTVRSVPVRAEDPVLARRRAWFVRAVAATASSLLVGLVVGGWLWVPFVLSAAATGGYVALLRHLKLQRDEARRVVRSLDLRIDLTAYENQTPQDVAVGEMWGASEPATVRLRRWDG